VFFFFSEDDYDQQQLRKAIHPGLPVQLEPLLEKKDKLPEIFALRNTQ
jgi:hypothetical protein